LRGEQDGAVEIPSFLGMNLRRVHLRASRYGGQALLKMTTFLLARNNSDVKPLLQLGFVAKGEDADLREIPTLASVLKFGHYTTGDATSTRAVPRRRNPREIPRCARNDMCLFGAIVEGALDLRNNRFFAGADRIGRRESEREGVLGKRETAC
jgi:hypothetical protein